ncbi:MAG: tRNA (N6-threonylcarbamoyladenosine(37)-N6)-methyltransferase TrmO [Bacteroidaceae bacterium]|nr:tRNA (N6-threonylcarbamoyladenosine(37)-N6)-methyltransferase TrmO [Bacteroidaceae bacterium]
MKVIAHIENDLNGKFGIPRQSGLVDKLESRIVFEPEYRNADALRGLEDFSHLWLIWDFSESHREAWSPTVRPPRLGGNKRMGVFATRSPFRPNPIGLSSVRILSIEKSSPRGPIIHVSGADLMNGTPIWDIKPYLPLSDCHSDASSGFAEMTSQQPMLGVVVPHWLEEKLSPAKVDSLRQILAADPRPHYQADGERIYGMEYAGINIKFKVNNNTLTIL